MTAHPVETWWTPDQMELVEDRSRVWHEQVFQPSDSVAFPGEEYTVARKKDAEEPKLSEGTVIPDGWEHEHCALCWRTISPQPGDYSSSYTDGKDWLCKPCYDNFIVPRTKEA